MAQLAISLASGILYGFKRAHVFLYGNNTMPTQPTDYFVVEGQIGKGASQTLSIEGLAKEPTQVPGSDTIYYQSRKGTGKATATVKLIDVPVQWEAKMLGRTITENGTILIGSDTEAPEAAIIAETETANGDKVYIVLFRGVLRREGMELNTADPNEDFTPDGVEYQFNMQESKLPGSEFDAQVVALHIGDDAGKDALFEALGFNNVVVPVEGITLGQSTANLVVGGTRQINATVLPSTATNKAVTYEPVDASIATVSSDGMITAIAEGSTTITVTTVDGNKTANVTVNVTEASA